MAIIANTSTEIGDVMLINPSIAFTGVQGINTFSDSVQGETADRFFTKEFRWSTDNSTWTSWETLNNTNLQGISVSLSDLFFIEYRYTRDGTDTTGTLTFNSVTIEGDLHEIDCGSEYANSIFSEYFSCSASEVITWAENVTQKMYGYGHVPNYIIRTGDPVADKDYLDFWRAVSKFFAYYVILARKYGDFYNNKRILAEYLSQRNVQLCGTETLSELQSISKNLYREFAKRGTSGAVDEGGELHRLICYHDIDKYLFSLLQDNEVGWVVNGSSPCYKGLRHIVDLNMNYEQLQDIEAKDNYPLQELDSISVVEDGDRSVMRIQNVPDGFSAGIGEGADKLIKIDPSVSYEICFQVKLNNLPANPEVLDFGVRLFDVNKNLIEAKKVSDLTGGSMFFEVKALPEGNYYQVRGQLHKETNWQEYERTSSYLVDTVVKQSDTWYIAIKNVPIGEPPPDTFYWREINSADTEYSIRTNIYKGTNLITNPDVVYMQPVIKLNNVSEANGGVVMDIWDIRIKPLSLPYNFASLNLRNFALFYLRNRNENITIAELKEIMDRYLLPYQLFFRVIPLRDQLTEAFGDFNEDFDDGE